MAHNIEPMDIDSSVCDFDDKENSFPHNNVLPRTPCTEKGYEELDVSELNMKLRYSVTPGTSPMSKSYTVQCLDNQNNETVTLDCENRNNMTRSLHSTLTKNDTIIKSPKSLPLQALSTDHSQNGDGNRNVLRPLDSTSIIDNVIVTVARSDDNVDYLSLPSSTSSMAHTPEATTPTKEISKDEGSPIMRGLKSVLNMFRASQSPIPLDDEQLKLEGISPPIVHSPASSDKVMASASTPLTTQKTKDPLARRHSPNTDSLVFSEDLEKELEWKDDSTILFGKEKMPIHKLFYQLPNKAGSKTNPDMTKTLNVSEKTSENLNTTVEYMDISYNDSNILDKATSKVPDMGNESVTTESDGEFVDAESTIKSESQYDMLLKSQKDQSTLLQESIPHESQIDHLNVTADTLNASHSDATDISSTSRHTAKAMETSIEKSEVLQEIEHNMAQDQKTTQEVTSLEEIGKPVSTQSNDNVPAVEHNFNNFVNSSETVNTLQSSTDNLVVSSISQIPLLADPRVLLFNVSPSSKKYDQSENIAKEVNTSPADIPLPDDEDIASLPSMNCALDNITQTLDKISEEIPKINQHAVEQEIMSSVSSADKLLDLTLGSLPVCEAHETSTSVETREVNMPLPFAEACIPSSVTIDDKKVYTMENKIEETSYKNQVLEPVTVALEAPLPLETVSTMDDTFAVINAIEELYPESANIERQSLCSQHTETNNSMIDMSVPIEKQIESKDDKKGQPAATHQLTKVLHVNESTKEDIQNFTPGEQSYSKVSFLVKDEVEDITGAKRKPDQHWIESNIYFIKQEIEAIINKSADIVMQRVIENNVQVKCDPDRNQNLQVKLFTDAADINNITEEGSKVCTSSLPIIKDIAIASTDNEYAENTINMLAVNQNRSSEINTLSMMGFQETNVNMNITRNSCQESLGNADKIDYKDSSEIIFAETMLKDSKNNQIINEIHSDMEKTEIEETDDADITKNTDEGFMASKGNSPFMVESQEQVADAIVADATFGGVDSSKLVELPPSSPAIMSKGYNFNFDEIDDPFATKSKIRKSPPLDASPNRSFETVDINVNNSDRRKSLPEKKKPAKSNTKNNSNFAGKYRTHAKLDTLVQPIVIESTDDKQDDEQKDKPEYMNSTKDDLMVSDIVNEFPTEDSPEICITESLKSDIKGNTNLQKSVHYSADTSFNKEVEYKNTFNVPEFSDPNLDSFAIKFEVQPSTVCQNTEANPFTSLPPANTVTTKETNSLTINSSVIVYGIHTSADGREVKKDCVSEVPNNNEINNLDLEEKYSENGDSTASSLKIEKDNSYKSVHTEDEDTIEGPFLEAEEFNNDDKPTSYLVKDNVEMEFSELPTGHENMAEAGEMFIDAEAFEFLLNQNHTNAVSDSGKESLFLKFDPLFTNRDSDGVLSALKKVQKKQSTPKKSNKPQFRRNSTFDKSPMPSSPTFTKSEGLLLVLDATFDRSPAPGLSTSQNGESSTHIKSEGPSLLRDATFDRSPAPGLSTSQNGESSTHIKSEGRWLLRDATFDRSPAPGLSTSQSVESSTHVKAEESSLLGDATFDMSPALGLSTATNRVSSTHVKSEGPLLLRDTTFDRSPATGLSISQNGENSTLVKSEKLLLLQDATFDKSPAPGLSTSQNGESSTPIKTEEPSLLQNATFDRSPAPELSTATNGESSTLVKLERTLLLQDATFEKSPAPEISTSQNGESITIVKPEAPLLLCDDKSPEPELSTFDKYPEPELSTSPNGESLTLVKTEGSSCLRDATFDESPAPELSTSQIGAVISDPSKLNSVENMDIHNATDDSFDVFNVTVSKPMMVVNPAMNAIVTPRNKSLTPVRSNRQSLTFTSPAIAVIDRLLSMSSANNSSMNHDTTVAEVRPDNEADLALTQLRELLADKEISVYNLRSETKELQNRLSSMESQVKNLETIGEERLKKINDMNEKLAEKIRLNKSMAKVVEEYERTIASLITETEQDKLRNEAERMQLIKERDQQTAHLASMEISFNDLHSKYEKSKQMILGFKANEDVYKKSNKEFEENVAKMQKNYELLKQHATSKLNYANEEVEKLRRAHESDVLRLNAMIKRKDLHITSLEETLQQKTKANEELTAICDELINRVSGSNFN